MPIDPKQYEKPVNFLQETYHVNFDFEGFIRKAEALGRGSAVQQNKLYVDTIKNLAKQYVNWRETGDRAENDFVRMSALFASFENLMSMIRDDRNQKKESWNLENGGMTLEEKADLMDSIANTMAEKPKDLYEKFYRKGDIRIRDMREAALALQPKSEEKDWVKVAAYGLMLEKVNDSRTILWAIFHPFRNNAEQREAKMIRDKINSVLPERTKRIYELAEQSFRYVEDEKADLASEREKIPAIYQQRKDEAKMVKEISDEMVKKEKAERLARKDREKKLKNFTRLLEIGYRPSPENVNKDIANANLIGKAIKEGKIIDTDTVDIFKVNFQRIAEVSNWMKGKDLSPQDKAKNFVNRTSQLAVQQHINQFEEKWKDQDEGLRNRVGIYDAKDEEQVLELFDELEKNQKQPISVPLNENKVEKVGDVVPEEVGKGSIIREK